MAETVKAWYHVTLSCLHSYQTRNAPEGLDDVPCSKCHAPRKVVAVSQESYRIKCDGCSYARYYGVNDHLAFTDARRHVTRKGHRVEILYGEEHLRWLNPSTMDSWDDVPPF